MARASTTSTAAKPSRPKPALRRSFGNVRQLPSGRWQAWYRLNGRHHAAPSTFRTQTEARDWLTTVQADLLRGATLVDARAGRRLLGAYAEDWYARRARAVIRPLAPTTAAKYRRLLDAYIRPSFADTQLGQITKDDVQDWFDRIARDHRSTAADAYRLLATIFRSAVQDRLVSASPCEIEGAGAMPATARPTVKLDELQRAIDATPERYRLAFLLAAWCGLRRGEVLGLRRRSFDPADGSITVTETWVQVAGARPLLKPPKSAAGARRIYLPPHVADAMVSHLERFVSPEPDAWLFGTASGTAVSPRNLSRAWDKARTKAGRSDLHLHDLRHTGLTWAAQAGATRAELMRMGGHATDAAARRYQQAEDDRLRDLAARMGRMVPNGVPEVSGA